MKQFQNTQQAEAYIEDMKDYSNNNMTIEDCSNYIIQAEEKRDLMYEWEISGTFELECEMREVSNSMAAMYLRSIKDDNQDDVRQYAFLSREEDTKHPKVKAVQLEQLLLLIELELSQRVPTQKELNELTEKIALEIGIEEKEIAQAQKEVECQITFQMEVGVLISDD